MPYSDWNDISATDRVLTSLAPDPPLELSDSFFV